MSEPEAASIKAALDALKALEEDASELELIENLLDRFNVFETIGFVNDEGLHSRFLAFLLDPKRNDGLSDRFIKGLVREALAKAQTALQPSTFEGLDRARGDLDSMDLSETLVRREHYAIDILLTNEDHRLAIIIENKIRAGEGRGQLKKYDTFVRYTYPGWDVLKIYLTPNGAAPSHNEYVRLSYGAVCGIVDRILEESGSALSPDVRVPMEHYARMVRRKILGDPEIVSLSQRMYRKHKRAFDLVYRHRPDYRTQTRPIVEELIREHPELEQVLQTPPSAGTEQKLMAFRSEVDDFRIHGREVYWLCRKKVSESSFSGAFLEKTLGMPATIRKATTVKRMAAKYPSSA